MTSLLADLVGELTGARELTARLAMELDDLMLHTQYHRDFSPIGWHLGHVAWQEECWALRRLGGQAPIDPSLDELYNTFESAKVTRARRLPSRVALERYVLCVRERTLELLGTLDRDEGGRLTASSGIFRFLANHERQHAETIGVVRLLGELYLPCGTAVLAEEAAVPAHAPDDFVPIAGGLVDLGVDDDPDSWDNERPRHSSEVDDFMLARYPVTAGEWLAFVEAGYRDGQWWTPEGAAWRRASSIEAPLFWRRGAGGGWWTRDLGGERPVREDEPVSHVSWHEAVAFSRFCGARLPTEAEWEVAAAWDGRASRKLRWPWGNVSVPDAACLASQRPAPVGRHPRGKSPAGVEDLIGNVWEWTADTFRPYPAFVAQAYRGYSEPWFDGRHRVCRGGSYLTDPAVARTTFRNFFVPEMRAVPLGLRLAKSP